MKLSQLVKFIICAIREIETHMLRRFGPYGVSDPSSVVVHVIRRDGPLWENLVILCPQK